MGRLNVIEGEARPVEGRLIEAEGDLIRPVGSLLDAEGMSLISEGRLELQRECRLFECYSVSITRMGENKPNLLTQILESKFGFGGSD